MANPNLKALLILDIIHQNMEKGSRSKDDRYEIM